MDKIKPRINLQGYEKALHEYGNEPSRIVEELVANSYDADATHVLIATSEKEVIVMDNGQGITDDHFPRLLDLGAGSKLDSHYSELKRSYLGSFGFGIKSTINIAKVITIHTINHRSQLSSQIDVDILKSHGFDKDKTWDGFDVDVKKAKPRSRTGTIINLRTNSDFTPDQIEKVITSLYNLPKAKDFAVYCMTKRKASALFGHIGLGDLASLKTKLAKCKADKIAGMLEIGAPKRQKWLLGGTDSIDISVWCNGLDSHMKVASLGQFAGVYVKVDGRVLKRNFQGEKCLDGVSKYPKFKHGMRVEIPFDWLKHQISLGRDGLQFANEPSKRKFENELKLALTSAVKPYARQLETRKARKVQADLDLRLRKAKERIGKRQSVKNLERTGYAFVPSDDYEMALIIANPVLLRKVRPSWVLMDFNGQQDFDCLVYDKKDLQYYRVELEPKLDGFLAQGVPENTECIITWARGDWKVGRARKGKRGYYELVENKEGLGHYRLIVRASERSKEPKQVLPVFCLDRIVDKMRST